MRAGECTECGEKDIRILEVHHIKPFAKGGSNSPENLSVLCPTCHQKAEKGLINAKPVTGTGNLPRDEDRRRRESSIEQRDISGGQNVGIGAARDVHIHQSSEQGSERRGTDDWDHDEEFALEPGGYRYFLLKMGVGDKLSGIVESEGSVSCYVLGPASFQSFEDEEEFNAYWETEGVTKTKVSFSPTSGHKFYFVVDADEDEEEDFSISVKLRVDK